MKITLSIFSGRSNPEWNFLPDNKNFDIIKNKIDKASENGVIYKKEEMESKLGYRGFLVDIPEAEQQKSKTVLIVGPNTRELQKLLLQTMPGDKTSMKTRLMKEIENSKAPRPVVGRKKRDAPDYDPARWNDANHIEKNNCYNYATDQLTDSWAEPGRANLHVLPKPYDGAAVQLAAERDFLVTQEVARADGHLVALVVDLGGGKYTRAI